GKGYRVIGLWGKVRGELGEVLERWFGAETVGKGGMVFGGSGLRDWLKLGLGYWDRSKSSQFLSNVHKWAVVFD
ncbi:hypothetical protein Tco_0991494, partial [Tanacetum coccineum]